MALALIDALAIEAYIGDKKFRSKRESALLMEAREAIKDHVKTVRIREGR